MKSIAAFLAVLMITMLTGALTAQAERINIAVATNFQTAMDDLEHAFETGTGHELVVSKGSSGLLYAQIRNGAPFAVFLSADEDRPARLVADGYAIADSRITYAIGRLVLWHRDEVPPGPDALARPDLRYIAIANPRLAPYGKAAIETLSALGLRETTGSKLLRGENVGQAFAFVRTGNAELGFIALSLIGLLPDADRGSYWLVPSTYHAPIRQDAVLISSAADSAAARDFLDFLESPEARDIIERHGYHTP